MGEYDLVEAVLAESGAEFFFTGVRMQPGKPVVFGRLPAHGHDPARCFFGLPGNPISVQVTFHCFVEPFLRALGGESGCRPRWAQATLLEAVAGKPGLTRLLPARMEGIGVRVVPWQGSGDLAANARANCYAKLLPGRDYRKGEVIRVLLR
jgi:molybdopterin molybdotransferase